MTLEQKRHTNTGIDTQTQGVGARHEDHPPPGGGGGYLDICRKTGAALTGAKKNAARDPRLNELRSMGLNRCWLAVAESIGYDAFMEAWQILDHRAPDDGADSRLRLQLPRFRTSERYQRNRYVKSLGEEGLTPSAIRKVILSELNVELSTRHIRRLINL